MKRDNNHRTQATLSSISFLGALKPKISKAKRKIQQKLDNPSPKFNRPVFSNIVD